MFYLRYLAAELRRRKGRTVLTAACLALGVASVIAVTSLSSGLDDAQAEVLEPLTGVGTEMTVTRPIQLPDPEDGGPPQGLSEKEQRQLQREGGGPPVGFDQLGDPGEKFDTYQYMTGDLSFPAAKVKRIDAVEGVESTSAGLTVNVAHISGTVPEESASDGGFGGVPGGAPPSGAGGPGSVGFDSQSVSGVDVSSPDLGAVTSDQVVDGDYFTGNGNGQAILSESYANENDLAVGDTVRVGERKLEVVGISSGAVAGESSDVYMELGALQRLADLEGRVNAVQVEATSSDEVDAVAQRIESAVDGSSVATASEVADQVSGSLVDAKNLSGKLGTALAIVALIGAFGIAGLVTLSSVNKRTRELGTLKALGWKQSLVVRQVAGESVVQGLIGGIVGVALGIAAAAAIGAAGISLDATLAASTAAGPGPGAPPGGPPGAEQAAEAVKTVTLGAPVGLGAILAAVGLAVLGGLLAGGVGGLRAARLRPAEALRSVE